MKKIINIEEIELNEGQIEGLKTNPRQIDESKYKKLIQSIKELPEMLEHRGLLVLPKNNKYIVVGGNMRLRALQELEYKEVWCEVLNESVSIEQVNEMLIKDNLSYGVWDWDLIGNEWDANMLNEWGMDLPDFKPEGTLEEEEFKLSETEERSTDVVKGDLIEIGKHRLVCGDSTEIDVYSKLFEDKLADLIITDPPYNVDYSGKTKENLKIQNDSMSNDEFYNFLYDFFVAQASFCKKGGVWYVWHADLEGANFRLAMGNAGIPVRQCLIWVKNSLVLGRQDFHWKHEPCLYGWKEGASHSWYNDRSQTTVLEFDRPSRNAEHPTMKPIELITYQIENSSKRGEIVADPFGGSGTTMVASEISGRTCYMIELDPIYCQVIIDRMAKLNPELTIKINGNPYVSTKKQEDETEY